MSKNKEKTRLKSIKHRAVCLTGSYKGSWRASKQKAYADGNNHVAEAGNQNHQFEVETKQVFRSRI